MSQSPGPAQPSVPSTPHSPRSPNAPSGSSPPATPPSPADGRRGKRIVVNLTTQRATLYEDSQTVRTMNISSGRPGHETPTDHFTIDWRDRDHRSSTYGYCVYPDGRRERIRGTRDRGCSRGSRYEGTPMPYYQRITDALGFHEGPLPGYPASHGCIRLSHDDAEFLWNWACIRTPVHIRGRTPSRRTR